ncbi:MAG: PAS domain S-box protein [Verrucomicrobiota bacterium]|nr:PAS domain S-box protein [Verrucomicrobiota bacterium]
MSDSPKKKTDPAALDGAGHQSPSHGPGFPTSIVGIGASAGGIQVLQEFFGKMPTESGLAFVVVMHLSPEHESSLAEILQSQTAMPVRQVNETVQVAPDEVYVIPPNKLLSMNDGTLVLSPPQERAGKRVAVDFFFRTLAEHYGQRSVCIVLSGSDGDGAIGVKHIKAQGGVTIAQDPGEAEYDSMPRHAIETGMVDWILPVAEMPARLMTYVANEKAMTLPPERLDEDKQEHPPSQGYGAAGEKKPPGGPLVAKETNDPTDESALHEVLAFLRSQTGHDFSHYKRATVLRRVARRLQVNSLDTIPAYLEFLRTHPDEVPALLRDLLICVTHFFRDRDAFTALEQHIPQLFAGKKSHDQVRVWVPACATGEEAYSIAILLSEHASRLDDPPSIQVFATDLEEEAIRAAREGVYPETIEAGVSRERLRRYFQEVQGRYRLRKEVRELVLFAEHDLLRDSPFSRLDLVSCRNLLIYLKPEAQQRVLDIFHFALRPGALLLLGNSENVDGAGKSLFVTLDRRQRLFTRRSTPRSPMVHLLGTPRAQRSARESILPRLLDATGVAHSATATEAGKPELTVSQQRQQSLGGLHLGLLEQYAPPSVVVDENYDILHISARAGEFLLLPGGEPSANLLKLVDESLRLDLRTALFRAAQEGENVTVPRLRLTRDGQLRFVDLHVRPAPGDSVEKFFLVLFEEKPATEAEQSAPAGAPAHDPATHHLEEELGQLRSQLGITVEQYEASGEELKASNEELQAMNEELRSASEELETSKEELQSINEELSTVNHELKSTLDELGRTHSDLQNLMASTDIGSVFLDRELRIKRYTPRVQELFNMIPTDLGRPLSDITSQLNYPELMEDAERVLSDLTKVEREVKKRDNGWFLARLSPYRALDHKINGVVVSFIDITERRAAREAVRESEEQFRRAIQDAPIPVIMHAEDGQVLQISRAWTELTGYTAEEIPTFEAWVNQAYGAGGEEVRRRMERLFHDETPMEQVEFEIRTRGGESRFWSLSASSPGTLRDGRRFVVAMALDITERKYGQEATAESERKYRTLFDSIDEGFCILEKIPAAAGTPSDYRFVEANPAFAIQSGVSEVVGKTVREVIPAEADEWVGTFEAVLERSEPLQVEGSVPTLERVFDAYVFRVDDQSQGRAAVVFKDITARKRAEEELRQSQEKFELLVEGARDYAIFLLDPSSTIIHWNSGAERIFGWSADEAVGKNGNLVFTPEDRAVGREQQELEIALRTGVADDRRWHIRKDGSRIWVDGVMRRLDDENGELRGFAKIARDATEQRLAEEELKNSRADLERRVEKRTAELTATNRRLEAEMSQRAALEQEILLISEREKRRIGQDLHDSLCQELAAAAFFLQSAAQKIEKKSSAQSKVLAEAARIVNDNVGLARDLARGLHPVELTSQGLADALRELAIRTSQLRSVTCHFDCPRQIRIRDEAVALNFYRIAQEAVTNALKNGKATVITIKLTRDRKDLCLSVKDNGKGFSVSKTRSGMGLHIMKYRADVIGAKLTVESADGKGAKVGCCLGGKEKSAV